MRTEEERSKGALKLKEAQNKEGRQHTQTVTGWSISPDWTKLRTVGLRGTSWGTIRVPEGMASAEVAKCRAWRQQTGAVHATRARLWGRMRSLEVQASEFLHAFSHAILRGRPCHRERMTRCILHRQKTETEKGIRRKKRTQRVQPRTAVHRGRP